MLNFKNLYEKSTKINILSIVFKLQFDVHLINLLVIIY